mgnify:CR=1 FL=1
MSPQSKLSSTEYADLNNVIAWFITLRWIACLGVLGALAVVHFFFDFSLPFRVLYLLTILLILLNAGFTIYYTAVKKKNLSRGELSSLFHLQIICDYILLFLLVYFTGFLENPFSYYFVFHIMLTSFIFPQTVVLTYGGILVLLFITVSLLQYTSVLPLFTLRTETSLQSYNELIFLRTFVLSTTIIISAYLITSIKNRIEERGKAVEVELDRYKSLDKIKSNFILQVTHELRGPLAALKGYHEMIMKGITGEIKPKTEEMLGKANRRTENLLTMIDEMIDFAYMKTEEDVQYTLHTLKLKDAIDYNVDLFETRAGRKHITIVTSCPKELEVYANRDLLNIILNNLITNAIKYSPENTTIRVNAVEENGEVQLTVKDEGMGIDENDLDKVFEEFYRTRKALEIEKDGTGLGLPIVQRAVDSLRGKITVYSELGKGTSFHIKLPKGGDNGTKENSDNR